MLIENFITYFVRKKNGDYLQFSPSSSTSIPVKKDNRPILLYLHIPFCEELCPYCSFNRIVFHEELARKYFQALRKEILMYKELGYDFKALYIGGGTPTILIDELKKTVDLLHTLYNLKEVSVETNPNHITRKNIAILKDMGVNRLSIGVQSFDEYILKAIERYHKYGSGEEIIERLKFVHGEFDTLNVDMIFNFPNQTEKILQNDISILIRLKVDQITYYPLMVSSSTQNLINKKLGRVDYARGGRLYSIITSTLSSCYRPSTAWCFSRSDSMIDEYVVNFEEYAGLGSGSIGYLDGCVYANTFDVEDYIRRIDKGILPITAKKDCSMKERLRYDFLMKLFGLKLDIESLKKKHGVNIYYYLWPEIIFFIMVGGLKKHSHLLSLTEKGQYYWVIMMREFFIGVNNFRDYCRRQIGQ